MKYALLFLCLFSFSLVAQDADLPLDEDSYHYLDRIDVLGLVDTVVPTSLKPYGRQETGRILSLVSPERKIDQDWHQRMRVLIDDTYADQNSEKAVLGAFFTNRRDVFSHRSEDLHIVVNPIVGLSYGQERYDIGNGTESWALGRNSRGIRVRGTAFGKVGFFTEFYDNLSRLPFRTIERFEQRDNIVGETFIKPFSRNENAVDFFHARSYLTYQAGKALRVKFGYDRVHWGHGYQSLFLSDQAANHLMLQARLRVWKLEYVSHFGQFIDFIPNKPDNLGAFPRKYGAYHMLTFRPNRTLSVSLFESVMYAPQLPGSRRGFELSYALPIIFYRAIEQSLGSPDNGSIGLQWKVNVLKKGQVYGQVLLDDFNFSRFRNDPDFWGNKYGFQIGGKVMDILPRLDLQAEYNRVRPYTYQHFNVRSNMTHYGQNLGHQYGANLIDRTVILRYRPVAPLSMTLRYTDINQGRDGADALNYGGDPTRIQSVDRPGDAAPLGQGYNVKLREVQFRASYQLANTPCFVDAETMFIKDGERDFFQTQLGLRLYLGR
ncbi:MAG: capsule assembly Wzi family protein [Bacteroidia bacterium]